MNAIVFVKLPRGSPETNLVTRLCQDYFGAANWNDSGKGNRFGTLTCEFRNVRNASAFLLELMQYGFTINVEAYL